MFEPFGSLPIACTSAPSCSNAPGASPAYAPFAQSTAMRRPVRSRAEALEHVLQIAVGRDADAVDLAAAGRGRVEQRLDLLLGGVGQLAARAVEELDAVVLGRVVRRGDDDAEVEAEQRDGRSRHDACEHRGAAGGDDAARERLFELLARAARVAPDEDAAAARPEGRRLAELLDEIDGEELADDAPDPVGAEVLPGHGAGP